jgi:hypothetical protein
MSCDRSFRVRTRDDDAFKELAGWKIREHIVVGSNQTKRFEVWVDGQELLFYFNNHRVTKVQGDDFKAGVLRVYITAAEAPSFNV